MPVTLPGTSKRPRSKPPGARNIESEKDGSKSTPRVTCLIIAPFDSAGARVKDTIERAMVETGIEVLSLDNLRPGAAWVNAITDAIKFSDFIIIDVSRQNPNVMYELGYAHALRKSTILLVSLETHSSIPSDLQGHLYVTYDPKNLRSLKDEIIRLSRRYIDARG